MSSKLYIPTLFSKMDKPELTDYVKKIELVNYVKKLPDGGINMNEKRIQNIPYQPTDGADVVNVKFIRDKFF